MSIWKNLISLEEIEQYSKNTMVEYLDMSVIEIGDDYIKGSMPVCAKTHMPMEVLHGGASIALAETLGSIAAYMAAPLGKQCVGLEVNANHVRPVKSGLVYARATPIHIGRSTQVWDVRISDEQDRTVSVSRITVAVLDG